MSKNEEFLYRHHTIKTLRSPPDYKARAFRGAKAVGETFVGPTEHAAVLAVKAYLDERAALLSAKRGPDGFPCVDEIRAALVPLRASMSEGQNAMLMAHLKAADHVLTATELAEAAGYSDYAAANLQYGQLAYDLAQELDWTPSETRNGVPVWTFTLADDADKESRKNSLQVPEQWRWRLRPEVIEALS